MRSKCTKWVKHEENLRVVEAGGFITRDFKVNKIWIHESFCLIIKYNKTQYAEVLLKKPQLQTVENECRRKNERCFSEWNKKQLCVSFFLPSSHCHSHISIFYNQLHHHMRRRWWRHLSRCWRSCLLEHNSHIKQLETNFWRILYWKKIFFAQYLCFHYWTLFFIIIIIDVLFIFSFPSPQPRPRVDVLVLMSTNDWKF